VAQNRFETGSQKRKPAHYRPTQEKAGLEAGLPPTQNRFETGSQKRKPAQHRPTQEKAGPEAGPSHKRKGGKNRFETGLKQVLQCRKKTSRPVLQSCQIEYRIPRIFHKIMTENHENSLENRFSSFRKETSRPVLQSC